MAARLGMLPRLKSEKENETYESLGGNSALLMVTALARAMDLAQGTPQRVNLAFIGIFLPFKHLQHLQHFFHLIQCAAQGIDNPANFLDGLFHACGRCGSRRRAGTWRGDRLGNGLGVVRLTTIGHRVGTRLLRQFEDGLLVSWRQAGFRSGNAFSLGGGLTGSRLGASAAASSATSPAWTTVTSRTRRGTRSVGLRYFRFRFFVRSHFASNCLD
jgi:hypothetical protein